MCWIREWITQKKMKIDEIGVVKVQRKKLKCIDEREVAVCVKGKQSFKILSDSYIEKRGRSIKGLEWKNMARKKSKGWISPRNTTAPDCT